MTRVQYLIIKAEAWCKLTMFRIRWALMTKAKREDVRRRAALLCPLGGENHLLPKIATMLFPDRIAKATPK